MVMHVFVVILCVLIAMAVGVDWGYKKGVEETEKRWSEAVQKAAEARVKT
jgi:hypothetical protein